MQLWELVYETAASAAMTMLDIADCLRSERECATLFDTVGFRQVVARRRALVETFESSHGQRWDAMEQAWTGSGLARAMPTSLPGVLRGLADADGADAKRLRDAASELEVLHHVVQELHELNQTLRTSSTKAS